MSADSAYDDNSLNYPLVSVLVLNYNGLRFLGDCFDSLLASDYPRLEIYLIDNNSSDDSIRFTQQHYPTVKIIQIGINAGYSRAYNLAMNRAQGKYLVLLNNDVRVDRNWLQPLVRAAEHDSGLAALQPKILSLLETNYFEYAGACGGYIDKYGYPFSRGRLFYTIEEDTHQYDDEVEVFWTSGAAMFLRADSAREAGYLDEDFFLHMEEIDLCWRYHLIGKRLKVIPASVIYHYGGATLQMKSYKKLYWNHRNNIFMMIKNMSTTNLFRILPQRMALDCINCIYSAVVKRDVKHSYAILSAYGWLLVHLRLMVKKRHQTQSLRRCPDSDFARLIYPRSLVKQYFMSRKKYFSSLEFRV